MPLIEVDEADKQAVIDAFAAHMQKRRERICIAIEQAGGVPVTALQVLLEVPARLGAGEHYDDVVNTVKTHCGAYVLGRELAAVTSFQ